MKKYGWNKFIGLPAVLLALVLTACAKETFVDEKPDVPEGYGLISLGMSLDHTSLETRSSIENPQTDPGTPEENYVEAVRMVLYGYDDKIVKYAFDFKIRTRTAEDDAIQPPAGREQWVGFIEDGVTVDEEPHLYKSENEAQFITYARKVEEQDYWLLILLNPTESADPDRDLRTITAVGQPLSAFEKVVSYAPTAGTSTYDQIRDRASGGLAADNYFLMNNHRGLIWVPASALRASVKAANENPVQVPVSRAVAKVQSQDGLPNTPFLAWVSNFKWELDITNKKTYWTRKLTYLLTSSGAKGDMEAYGPVPPINEFPGTGNPLHRPYLYAEDPNFTGLSSIGAPDPLNPGNLTGDAREEKLKELRWGEFNLLEYPGVDTWNETVDPTPTLTRELGEFAYCLENTMDVDDQYNGVITRILLSCTYWPAGYGDEEGYFIYNNYYVLPSEMRDYASGGSSIPTELQGLAGDIAALLTATGIDLKVARTASFSSNNIRYYHQGLNFYAANIQHNSDTPGYGNYGVLRNNVYTITFHNILGPGSPIITEPEYNNLAVGIEVQKWYDRTQFTEL